PPPLSFTHAPPHAIYTLSLHDALPICMSAEERGHSRTLRVMHLHAETQPASILKTDRWSHTGYGGSLRAAVFGANDGLLSNFGLDRKSTRLNSSHLVISYAVFCLKKKT